MHLKSKLKVNIPSVEHEREQRKIRTQKIYTYTYIIHTYMYLGIIPRLTMT